LKIESITTKKVTKEVFLEVSTWTHKVLWRKKKHQINTYLKDIISLLILMNFTFWPAETKTKLEQKNKCWKISYC
jgi:hypothetical protein